MAEWSARARLDGRSVGLVPTMGALHAGHLALVREALNHTDRVVCSIFVNPLQFNDPNDLAHYPRTLEKDAALLEEVGCHLLFAPEKDAIFAGFTPRRYDLSPLGDLLEGPLRPGHFLGVVNVVERLFYYVRPDQVWFGEKDRQQLAMIRQTASRERWPERIHGFPTVREHDGLAMSSRNLRLSEADRKAATALYRALRTSAEVAFRSTVQETLAAGHSVLASEPGVSVEYFAIVDPGTLMPLTQWGDLDSAVALVAAQVGPVRLIDNVTLHRPT